MKKIIIFGATGTIGQQLVEQATQSKNTVTAFVRNPKKLQKAENSLKIHEGDVLNYANVLSAVKGQDVVIVALGAGRQGKVRSVGTKNIIEAMKDAGVKRLICQSTLGTGDSNQTLNFFWKNIMFGWFLKEAFLDHEEQERLVRDSGLAYTIVRPGAFTNGPLTGDYTHGAVKDDMKLKLKVSREDVASFILNQMDSDQYLNQSPILSY